MKDSQRRAMWAKAVRIGRYKQNLHDMKRAILIAKDEGNLKDQRTYKNKMAVYIKTHKICGK